MEIAFEYLNTLLNDTNKKRSKFKYFEVTEINTEEVYLSSRNDLCLGKQCGLMNEWRLQELKIKEQIKLRKGTKNYLRIIKKDNHIEKIESFSFGRVDVVYLALYETNTRYLFPFSDIGEYYPTYVYVTKYADGLVSEEYMVQSGQIVYEKYVKSGIDAVSYSHINYVPNGTHKILDSEKGIFKINSIIDYSTIETTSWFDK